MNHLEACEKIRCMKFGNYLSSLAFGASLVGANALKEEFEILERKTLPNGKLPESLCDYRYRLYLALMTHARTALDSDAYLKFYTSF